MVSLVSNPVDHQANKHIRISCHYSRELAEQGVIAPQRVATENNVADIFTKALGGVAFKALVAFLVRPVVAAQQKEPSVPGGVAETKQKSVVADQQGSATRGGGVGHRPGCSSQLTY